MVEAAGGVGRGEITQTSVKAHSPQFLEAQVEGAPKRNRSKRNSSKTRALRQIRSSPTVSSLAALFVRDVTMNDVTFLGLSDAGISVWVWAMSLWTIFQVMWNVARQLDKNRTM